MRHKWRVWEEEAEPQGARGIRMEGLRRKTRRDRGIQMETQRGRKRQGWRDRGKKRRDSERQEGTTAERN